MEPVQNVQNPIFSVGQIQEKIKSKKDFIFLFGSRRKHY